MSKIAVVTDSNSGITQDQASLLGISVLPMPFMINEETFYEDITLSNEEFYQKLASDVDIRTSQPSPADVRDLWENLLSEYDEIVHIPMSSGLSGSCESAFMLAQDFDGKVVVVNNQRISVTQRQSVLDALMLVKRGHNAFEIKQMLEEDKYNSSIYIMLDTLYYLKKGGRITSTAAALGTILKIKPILQLQGEKLDAFAKARTSAQGKTLMLTAIKNDIINRFGGFHDKKNIWIQIAHTNSEEAAEVLRKDLSMEFEGYEIFVDHLSLSVACHLGPGALAIACCKKMSCYEATC